MPDKREDKGTRRQGDKGTRRQRGFLLFSLSPRPLVPLSLLICLLAAPTRHAQQQNPREQEGKAKTPPISSHVVLITISGLKSDLVTGAESQRLNIPTIQALRTQGSYAVGIESVFQSEVIHDHASMVPGPLPGGNRVNTDYSFEQVAA